jgi:hypothetical protein
MMPIQPLNLLVQIDLRAFGDDAGNGIVRQTGRP